MSDPGRIEFLAGDGCVIAAVYVHDCGSDVDDLLREFFDDETRRAATSYGMYDLRWNHASYLAARFVRWFPYGSAGLGIGIVPPTSEPSFVRVWEVRCLSPSAAWGRPLIYLRHEDGTRHLYPNAEGVW